jgi:hypothetical protein
MPVAIVGLAAAVVGGVAASVIGGVAGAIVGALITTAISFAGSALFAEKPKKAPAFEQPLTERKRTIRAAVSPRQVIIGRVRVGGTIVYVHGLSRDGVADKFLLLVIVFAGHRVDSLETIWLDNVPLTDPKFAGLVGWQFQNGTPDQTPPPWFIEDSEYEWTAEHRCAGCALLYLRLMKDDAAFPNGMPEVSATIRGANMIPDPRTGTLGYSANPARVVGWYLSSPLGLGEPLDAIDEDTWIAAANICDEDVPLKAGGTEKRYRCHGAVTLDQAPGDVLKKLLSSCAGDAIVAGGQWYIEPGAWRPSNRVITADEVRGAISVTRNRAFRDLANGVRATYVREAADWEETDAPPLLDSAAVAEDGGEPVYEDLELPFTLSGTVAQRIMQIRLRRLRAQRSYRIPTMLHHIGLRPGSVVSLDLPRQPRDTVRLAGWTLDADQAGITLVAEQDDAQIYAWNPETDERPLLGVGSVTPLAGTDVTTPVITVTPPTAPVPSTIAVSWSAVPGAASYQLDWRGPAGGAFTETSQAGTSATISTADRAEFRVRAIGGDADSSLYDSALFPTALRAFTARGAAGGIECAFDGAYAIQVFRASVGTAFASATYLGTLSAAGALSLSAGTYDIWARPVSAKGVVGPETAAITVTVADDISGGSTGTPPGTPPQGYVPPGGEGTGGTGEGSSSSDSDSPGGDSGGPGGET